ncbi:unnamed protein product, partial [Chrysoparadoxa australica]
LSDNSLSGTLDGVFTVHYCKDGGSICATTQVVGGGIRLNVLLLRGNGISGSLPATSFPERLAVLDLA